MPDLLLSTKLHIPRSHRELVARPRLLERLDTGLRGKLTLVSAPAGCGKTTLVSDWIHRRAGDMVTGRGGVLPPRVIPPATEGAITAPLPVAWLSLDPSDNNLALFFVYLIAALQQIDPCIGASIQPILQADAELVVERLQTTLVNDIAASDASFALVLDDYHVIHEIEIHQVLDFMFDHIPPGMHVVLLSRTDPPMPLGRLRVQGQLTEIREADLRFTVEETTAFFNDLMGLELPSADVKTLERRTEGWVAGLQLAALSLQDRSDRGDLIAAFGGSHRHLVDYLVPEVMSRQPEYVRTFLLYTSILERFSAPLCDSILKGGLETHDQGARDPSLIHRPSSPSRRILDHLEQANLFLVPLDGERRWYRYHHLFTDLLRHLLREAEPDVIPELLVRASQWYETEGMVDEAIEHALAADDVTRATRLLDEHIEAYVFNAEIIRVRRWVNRLPPEVQCSLPRLCVYYAWALQFEYRLEKAEEALAMAETHLADPARLPKSFPPAQLAGHIQAIRGYAVLHAGELDRAVALLLAALGALPDEGTDPMHTLRGAILLGLGIGYLGLGRANPAREALQAALPHNQRAGNRYGALSCIYYLVRNCAMCGSLNRALSEGENGLRWIAEWSKPEAGRRPPARMWAHLRRELGVVHYERNDLGSAAENLGKAIEYYELVGSLHRVTGYALLVDVGQALGHTEVALRQLARLKQASLAPGLSLPDSPVAAMVVDRGLLLYRMAPGLSHFLSEAVEWAETCGLGPSDPVPHEREYEYLTLARVRIAQGRAEEALPLLERLVSSAGGAGRTGELIAHLSLQAVAQQAVGDSEAALCSLTRALALGEPEGYVRSFVDHGAPMVDLLKRCRASPAVSQAYVDRLLAALGATAKDRERAEPASLGRPPPTLVEPLSDRETQILRLLAVRRSYREIAEELYLSLNTVKWYIQNIYGKLGVNRRDQAVARAQRLGIL